MLRQALAVARKDLSIELRTKESLNASAAFAISILLLFSFAFDAVLTDTNDLAAGLLWLVFAFAGALVFNRGFARELPNECLDALLASQLSAASLIIGKALANLAMLLIVEVISLLVLGLFFNVHWMSHPFLLAILFVVATWGISVLGAVFGALTVNLRLRELMLPVIIYPVLVPLLIAAIEITITLFSSQPVSSTDLEWGKMLVIFDVVFTALAVFLADTILVN
ncbi:MAG TPA: heme exporter protein CcmB [Bryobacteraceae bacterium]|jgi:heme exporter protein B